MKEIIQKMRNDAHEIAIKRAGEVLSTLSPSQVKNLTDDDRADLLERNKPGVIELDPGHPPTPFAVQLQLMMLDVFVPLGDLATRTMGELEEASLWAATCMLDASDNDVMIAPRPQWLPARDGAAGVPQLVGADIEYHGGEKVAERIYGEEWLEEMMGVEDDDVGDLDDLWPLIPAPAWAQRLRDIADALINVCPEELIPEGEWLNRWLDAGAPMFGPVNPGQDSTTPASSSTQSTESTDGNASTTEFRRESEHTIRTD